MAHIRSMIYRLNKKVGSGHSNGDIVEDCVYNDGTQEIIIKKGIFKDSSSNYTNNNYLKLSPQAPLGGEHLSNKILHLAFKEIGFTKKHTRETYFVNHIKLFNQIEFTPKAGVLGEWVLGEEFKQYIYSVYTPKNIGSTLDIEFQQLFSVISLLGVEDIKPAHFLIDENDNIIIIDNKIGNLYKFDYLRRVYDLLKEVFPNDSGMEIFHKEHPLVTEINKRIGFTPENNPYCPPAIRGLSRQHIMFAFMAIEKLFKDGFEEKVKQLVQANSPEQEYYDKIIQPFYTMVKSTCTVVNNYLSEISKDEKQHVSENRSEANSTKLNSLSGQENLCDFSIFSRESTSPKTLKILQLPQISNKTIPSNNGPS